MSRQPCVDRPRARTLLTAVAVQPGVAPRLVGLFALMYYAALRPGEALDFREENLTALPATGWGELLRCHLDHFGTAPDGRLFVGPRGGTIGDSTYHDLRHAAVSTWLNAGVPATQVAEWAGHSVAVLLRVYAKCIIGQDAAARRRIEDAMRDDQGG